MKKNIVLGCLVFILINIFVVGCSSNKSTSNGTVAQLQAQAQKYATGGKLDDAIEVYGKILNIKEDEILRNELNEIKYEKESVNIAKEFIDNLKEVNSKIPSGNKIESAEMQDIFFKINDKLKKLESIDITKKTAIAEYVSNLKKISEYSSMKGTVTTAINIPNGNTMALGLTMPLGRRNLEEEIPDLLAVKFPEKYGSGI